MDFTELGEHTLPMEEVGPLHQLNSDLNQFHLMMGTAKPFY